MTDMTKYWDDVFDCLEREAIAITWEGCHKIYVILDQGQLDEFISYGYEPIGVDDPHEALATLRDWYDMSCFLRFISAVRTVDGNPNDGYKSLIPQGAEEEDDEA